MIPCTLSEDAHFTDGKTEAGKGLSWDCTQLQLVLKSGLSAPPHHPGFTQEEVPAQ